MKHLTLLIFILNNLFLSAQSDSLVVLCDGFEKWDSLGVPENWIGDEIYGTIKPNIGQENALTEGDYSLVLRANVPQFDELSSTSVLRFFDSEEEYRVVNVELSYKCLGAGGCRVELLGSNDNSGFIKKEIWSVWSPNTDTLINTVKIENIEPVGNIDFFNGIKFTAIPSSFSDAGEFGHCEFFIDELKVTKQDTITGLKNSIETKIYPNPVSNFLNIDSAQAFEKVIIYDKNGERVKSVPFNQNLNLSFLKNGIYFLLFIKNENKALHKIIKN